MLVGEVRCASIGPGSSWKLSGGSQWSSAATKSVEVAPALARDAPQELALVVAELGVSAAGTGRLSR